MNRIRKAEYIERKGRKGRRACDEKGRQRDRGRVHRKDVKEGKKDGTVEKKGRWTNWERKSR